MDAKILIMRTDDWDKMTPQSFVKTLTSSFGMFFNPGMTNEHREMLVFNLSRWAKFSIPYIKYRTALKNLAMSNWIKLACDIRPLWGLHWPANKDRIYLFTDDDDWFHPNILQEVVPIFEQRPEIEFVTWDCWMYILVWECENFTLFPKIGSNGYAMRGGHEYYYGASGGGHLYVDQYKEQHPDRVVHIPKALSIWVRHPGTFSHITSYPLTTNYAWFRKQPRPDHLAWAAPYMDEVFDLIHSLTPAPVEE